MALERILLVYFTAQSVNWKTMKKATTCWLQHREQKLKKLEHRPAISFFCGLWPVLSFLEIEILVYLALKRIIVVYFTAQVPLEEP